MAGAVLQTLTNNPLASASTLGINAGAYFFRRCIDDLLSIVCLVISRLSLR